MKYKIIREGDVVYIKINQSLFGKAGTVRDIVEKVKENIDKDEASIVVNFKKKIDKITAERVVKDLKEAGYYVKLYRGESEEE
jgi:hypothetical protein